MNFSRIRTTLATFAVAVSFYQSARADAGDDQYAVAAGHYARSRWQLAVDEFATFLTDFPDHPRRARAWFFQGEAQVQLARLDDARRSFQEFLRIEPDHDYAPRALFRAGECAYLNNDYDDARRDLSQFAGDHPKHALNQFVLAYLGNIAASADDHADARDFFSECLERYPDGAMRLDCYFGLGRALENTGNSERALAAYQKVIAVSDSRLADDALYQAATVQYEREKYRQAAALFTRLLRDHPSTEYAPRAQLAYGWTLFQQQQYDDAIRRFNALKDHGEVGDEARYWLGLTYKAQGDWEAAADALGAAAERRGNDELDDEALFQIGDALARSGDLDEARKHLNRLLDAYPDAERTPDALAALLRLAHDAGDTEEVARLRRRIESDFPDSQAAQQSELVYLRDLIAREQFDEAASRLQHRLAKRPAGIEDAERHALQYLLVRAYQGLDRHDEALEILAKFPSDVPSSLASDAQLAAATSFLATEQNEKARSLLRRYIKNHDAHQADDDDTADHTSALAAARGRLAVAYARLEDISQAKSAYAEFIRLHPDHSIRPWVTAELAESAYRAGAADWSTELFAELGKNPAGGDFAPQALSGLAWSQFKANDLPAAASTFRQLLDEYPRHDLAPEAAFTYARILEQQQKYDPALVAYRAVVDDYPRSEHLAAARHGVARMYDTLNQDAQALASYQAVLQQHPDYEHTDQVLYKAAWAAIDSAKAQSPPPPGDSSIDSTSAKGKLADELFHRLRDEFPDSQYWGDATYRLAETAFADGDLELAERLAGELLEHRPDGQLAEYALFLRGQTYATAKNWSAAAQSMTRLLEDFPDTTLRPLAEYWIAESTYRQGDYQAAGDALDRVYRTARGRDEPWVAMVLLRRAQVAAHAEDWDEAQQLAASIAEQFPDFPQRYEVDYLLGRCHASKARFQEARDAYRRVTQSEAGGKTETAAMAQWMIGETFMHQKNYRTALREFHRLEILYAYPTWQALALLQAGKCHELLGQWQQAIETYEHLLGDYATADSAGEAERRLRVARQRLAAAAS